MILSPCYWLLLAAAMSTAAEDTLAKAPPVRKLRLTYTCQMDKVPEGAKTIDLWMPIPSDNDRQTVQLLNPDALRQARVTSDKKYGNRMVYRRFDGPFANGESGGPATANGAPIKIELVYDVEVRENVVQPAKQLVSTQQAKPGPEMAVYLGDTSMIPIKGRVSQLALEIPLPEGEPLRAGRKIYDYLVDTMKYNHKAPGAGLGDAVWACDSKTGDCHDFHSVFIGVCRWRGIPADHVFGFPMPADKPEGEIKYCHCWAQFWVAGIGWIPIDASRANKYPSQRDYYFGTLGSAWLTLTHGRDVILEPPHHGPPLNLFEAPRAEIDGQPTKDLHWLATYKDR